MTEDRQTCETCDHFRADPWGSSGRCLIGPEQGRAVRGADGTVTVKRERPPRLATSTCDKHAPRAPDP